MYLVSEELRGELMKILQELPLKAAFNAFFALSQAKPCDPPASTGEVSSKVSKLPEKDKAV